MPARKTAAAAPDTAARLAALDFEAAMGELEALIGAVENNRLPLEETLQSYQRGQQLIARCAELLRDAEARIRQFDGETEHDFDPEARR